MRRAYTYADGYSHAVARTDSDIYSDPDSNSYGYVYPYAYSNGYSHAIADPDSNSYADGNSDSYSYSNGDSASSNANCNSNCYTDAYANGEAETYTDAEAATNAGPSPVALTGFIKAGTRKTHSRVPA